MTLYKSEAVQIVVRPSVMLDTLMLHLLNLYDSYDLLYCAREVVQDNK